MAPNESTAGCPHWSRRQLAEVLETSDTKREAADRLDVDVTTIRRWEQKHGLDGDR